MALVTGSKSGAFIAPIVMRDSSGNERTVITTNGNVIYGFQSGNQFYVDSGGTGASDSNDGLGWSSALATLDAAIAKCTANNGDVIWIAPGHSETYTTTGTKLTVDVAGVTIIGLGSGASRPTFTFGHTGATFAISSASCYIENIVLASNVDQITTFCTISGADCTLVDIETRDTTDKEAIDTFITTAAADRLKVIRHFHNGYTGGDANARVWKLVGTDNALFDNCRFMTKVTTAVINFTGTSCTNVVVKNSDFLVTSTTDLSKTVVDTVGSSTWEVTGSFDLGAGAGFSGGSGAALAKDDVSAVSTAIATLQTVVKGTDGLDYGASNYIGVTVPMNSATWNTAASHEILTITGMVRVKIIAECTATLTDSGNAGTIQLGVEGATSAFIASTDSDDIVTGDLWYDATPTLGVDTTSSVVIDKIIAGGLDVGYEIGGEALTGGTLVFHCWWTPLNATGAVVAGAGGTL